MDVYGLQGVLEMRKWIDCLALVVFPILVALWFGPARRMGPMVREWIQWLLSSSLDIWPRAVLLCAIERQVSTDRKLMMQRGCWADAHRLGRDLCDPIPAPRWSLRQTNPPRSPRERRRGAPFHRPPAARMMPSGSSTRFVDFISRTSLQSTTLIYRISRSPFNNINKCRKRVSCSTLPMFTSATPACKGISTVIDGSLSRIGMPVTLKHRNRIGSCHDPA